MLKSVGVVIMALLLFSPISTSNNEVLYKYISPRNQSITAIITTRYSHEQLVEIASLGEDYYELDSLYPVQCLRRFVSLNTCVYSAFYLGKSDNQLQ